MPGMDGHTLIEKVRALESETGEHTPAIALTAYASVDDRSRVLASGFDRYVPKPVDHAVLSRIVASVVGAGAHVSFVSGGKPE